MRIISSTSAITAALALALLLAAGSRPAAAGKVCDKLRLRGPCITSSDLKAQINLKEAGKDGRLLVKDADNATAVSLDGSSGNLTNLFSNDQNEGNGLVKAWAQLDDNGNVVACWRCNTDPSETQRLAGGLYEVDFTPLSTDIRGRPRSATANGIAGRMEPGQAFVILEDQVGDSSSVLVAAVGVTGFTDTPFVLIIY